MHKRFEFIGQILGTFFTCFGIVWQWLKDHQDDASTISIWLGLLLFLITAGAKIRRWIKQHKIDDKN